MEERIKILEMLASGVISASEANELLSTIDNKKVEVSTTDGIKNIKMSNLVKNEVGKNLIIKVISNEGDKVNINIPVAFIKAAIKAGNVNNLFDKSIKIGGNKNLISDSIDMDLLVSYIENGAIGNIIDVESADGDIVKIYIE